MNNKDFFTYHGRKIPVGAKVSLVTNRWKLIRGGQNKRHFVGTIYSVASCEFEILIRSETVIDGKEHETISIFYSDIESIEMIDGMKKTELLEEKLASANLDRAAYEISRHVSDVYDEGLFEILEEHERMENRPLARVSYEKESKVCNGQEAYVVYLDPQRTDDWGLDMAFPMNNDMINYQLVTKIRELMKLGYEIIWS